MLIVGRSQYSFDTLHNTAEGESYKSYFLHNINWLDFITETDCAYCAVRTESSYVVQVNSDEYTVSIFTVNTRCHYIKKHRM